MSTGGDLRADLRIVLRPEAPKERPMVRPETADALRAELASCDAREARLLIEISKLHERLGYIRACCQTALAFCMHERSLQAESLRDAIAKTQP